MRNVQDGEERQSKATLKRVVVWYGGFEKEDTWTERSTVNVVVLRTIASGNTMGITY